MVDSFVWHVLERGVDVTAFLCFAIFGKNSKWSLFLKTFSKVGIVYCLDTPGIENFYEIVLSSDKEIEINFVFCHFWQNSKIQNGHHF